MPLPLKEAIQLPDNKVTATKRLNQLRLKMQKNVQHKDDYLAAMMNVIKKGYTDLVPEDELEGKPGRVWYIPHHGVYHPMRPGRLRVVYDCSAEYKDEVLNRWLLQVLT